MTLWRTIRLVAAKDLQIERHSRVVTNQVLPTPITVQPAEVTVLNQHPARAEQTVERDANDEIVKTITTYHQE